MLASAFKASHTSVFLRSSSEWLRSSDPAPPQPRLCVEIGVSLGLYVSPGATGLEAGGSTGCLSAAQTGTGPAQSIGSVRETLHMESRM